MCDPKLSLIVQVWLWLEFEQEDRLAYYLEEQISNLYDKKDQKSGIK